MWETTAAIIMTAQAHFHAGIIGVSRKNVDILDVASMCLVVMKAIPGAIKGFTVILQR